MYYPEVAERLKLCVDLRVNARPGQKESQEEPRFTSPFDKGVKLDKHITTELKAPLTCLATLYSFPPFTDQETIVSANFCVSWFYAIQALRVPTSGLVSFVEEGAW